MKIPDLVFALEWKTRSRAGSRMMQVKKMFHVRKE